MILLTSNCGLSCVSCTGSILLDSTRRKNGFNHYYIKTLQISGWKRYVDCLIVYEDVVDFDGLSTQINDFNKFHLEVRL